MAMDNKLVIVIILIVALLLLVKNFEIFSIQITKDTVYIPQNFELEIFEEKQPLSKAQLEFQFQSNSRLEGGCVNVPSCFLQTSPASLCIQAGFADRGCGWNSETRCSCNSCQVGCFKVIEIPPTDVSVKVAGQEVFSKSGEVRGTYLTSDFSKIANNYCAANTRFDQNPAGECSVPISVSGSGSAKVNLISGRGEICVPNFECKNDEPNTLQNCINNKKTITCIDLNGCEQSKTETIDCCVENWVIEDWSDCINGEITRTTLDTNNCNVNAEKPIERLACQIDSDGNIIDSDGVVIIDADNNVVYPENTPKKENKTLLIVLAIFGGLVGLRLFNII